MSGGSVAPDLSKALADKMLQGWTMLADLCPVPNCHVSGPPWPPGNTAHPPLPGAESVCTR